MSKKQTPIALFIYNRPDHTQLVLETLSRCSRLEECRLHIFSDGAKRPEHAAGVEATRAVMRRWSGRLDAEVVERAENLGLARSIVEGVGKLCADYGRVIVIEDDFVLSPDFLSYMLEALDKYESHENIYQISGYQHPIEHLCEEDACFLPLTTTWGWATWARAWRIFDWEAKGALECMADAECRARFDLNDSYPYAEMLEQKLAGQNDSWGILFWWAVFQARGLVLHPRRSLVWVGGFDGTGVHCGESDVPGQPARDVFDVPRLSSPLELPERVLINEAAFAKVRAYLMSQSRAPQKSLRLRLKSRLSRYFQKS